MFCCHFGSNTKLTQTLQDNYRYARVDRKSFNLFRFLNGHDKEIDLNNSQIDSLRVPGVNAPSRYEIEPWDRFAHAFYSWCQEPSTTLQEMVMLRFMNDVTERADWTQRLEEGLPAMNEWRDAVIEDRTLLTRQAMDWCFKELCDTKTFFEENRGVITLNIGSGVWKSDEFRDLTLRAYLQLRLSLFSDFFKSRSSHRQISMLIDPSVYPFAYTRTHVLTSGHQLDRNNAFDYMSGTETIRAPNDTEIAFLRLFDPAEDEPWVMGADKMRLKIHGGEWASSCHTLDDSSMECRWSTKYQWLPFEVQIRSNPDSLNSNPIKAKITSYINNVHPSEKRFYSAIEDLLPLAIKAWNHVLVEGDEDRAPPRILLSRPPPPHGPPHPPPGSAPKYEDWKALSSSDVSFTLEEDFSSQGLQCVLEAVRIDLTPEDPDYRGEAAHLIGLLNEHIAATARFYIDVQNVTDLKLTFLAELNFQKFKEEDISEYRREFGDGVDDENRDLDHRLLGSVPVKTGRMLAWPNTLLHCHEPFSIKEMFENSPDDDAEGDWKKTPEKEKQSGHILYIDIHLVDPTYRILSTRNVPPQQPRWWWLRVVAPILKARGLPQELVDKILENVDDTAFHREEAIQMKNEAEVEKRIATGIFESTQNEHQMLSSLWRDVF